MRFAIYRCSRAASSPCLSAPPPSSLSLRWQSNKRRQARRRREGRKAGHNSTLHCRPPSSLDRPTEKGRDWLTAPRVYLFAILQASILNAPPPPLSLSLPFPSFYGFCGFNVKLFIREEPDQIVASWQRDWDWGCGFFGSEVEKETLVLFFDFIRSLFPLDFLRPARVQSIGVDSSLRVTCFL